MALYIYAILMSKWGFSMKKVILIALLITGILPVIGMDYFKNLFYRPMVTTTLDGTNVPTITTIKPLIANIAITNEINFSQILNDLQNAANNSQVHVILIFIDNYGGTTGSFSAVHDMIKKVATFKPVVGLIVGNAFSGGYWIASACDYLICPSCSELGSIGSIYEVTKYKEPKMTGNLEAILEVDLVTAGEYKGLTHPHKKWSEKERAYLKAHTDKMYMLFVKAVAQNRNLNIDTYQEWADAKIFLSPEALELGLVDEIGTIFEAEDKLREMITTRNPDCVFEKEITYLTKTATMALPAQ